MTKAGGGDLHQDFALAGTVKIHSFNFERLTFRKGTLEPLLIHNGSGHLHRWVSVGLLDGGS